ncbi:uncharacterized protein [Aegilops tauschii subsp. strangulata]|uniref:uncharacterized protein isoform X2 n=1 Tax=Aegilops tauschii subsp. strangulata TaxID=200361 RepID=UPI00098A5E86
MAAVLRSAARRLAGELPAAEMGLHRLPLHSQLTLLPNGSSVLSPLVLQANVWSASSAPRSAPSSLTKTKAVIESTLLPQLIPRRTMSSSSGRAASQPADKFWLEIVGHRMKGPQNPCPMIFRKRISGVDADKAEAVFLDVMMMAKYDGNVPPNMMSSPVRALLRKALIRYMKIKWFIKEIALSLKIRVVFKLGKLNFAVICVLLYVTYGRPLSLLRRFWKILNSQGGDDSE